MFLINIVTTFVALVLNKLVMDNAPVQESEIVALKSKCLKIAMTLSPSNGTSHLSLDEAIENAETIYSFITGSPPTKE